LEQFGYKFDEKVFQKKKKNEPSFNRYFAGNSACYKHRRGSFLWFLALEILMYQGGKFEFVDQIHYEILGDLVAKEIQRMMTQPPYSLQEVTLPV
jgi:hypothetical protein